MVFPTSGCNLKLHFLDCLRAAAKRDKLKEENFWLHKFRATFATWSLWAGVDLRPVQSYLGHSYLESTMRCLKPSWSQEAPAKQNEVFSLTRVRPDTSEIVGGSTTQARCKRTLSPTE